MVTLNPSTSGEEDSQLEQDGSPLASGQEEMATNLRVVADISSSWRSFNGFFFGGGGGFGGLVLGCWEAYLSFVFATDTPKLC